jgi:hypothetical protein
VLGQVAASPRRVHHLAGIVLASLIGRGSVPVRAPTLVKTYDYTSPNGADRAIYRDTGKIVPHSIIRSGARALLRTLLEAPLCYAPGGRPTGTLKSLQSWCAARHAGLKLHFAKTGTQVTQDPDATVDAWIAGGLQFSNGAAYSYVVVVGTGAASEPWARKLHASQVAAPLLDELLNDLEADAKAHPRPDLLRARPRAPATVSLPHKAPAARTAADALHDNLIAN